MRIWGVGFYLPDCWGGVIQASVFKFPSKTRTLLNTFSRYHRKLFIWIFPVFLLLMITGASIALGLFTAIPMTAMVTKDTNANIHKILFPWPTPVKAVGEPSPMLPISRLMSKAKEIEPDIVFNQIRLVHWNDRNAQIELTGHHPSLSFLNGGFNMPSITLRGTDGTLVKQTNVMDRVWSLYVVEAFFYLHILPHSGFILRCVVALLMVAVMVGLGFGVMLWLEKKSRPFTGKAPFYHWTAKISLAVMLGVIPATALAFNLQWILPMELPERLSIQTMASFHLWLGTLTWSFYQIQTLAAARALLRLGGGLCLLAPVTHWVSSGVSPLALWQGNMTAILGVDIGLILCGTILIAASWKLPSSSDGLLQYFSLTPAKGVSR